MGFLVGNKEKMMIFHGINMNMIRNTYIYTVYIIYIYTCIYDSMLEQD